MSDVSVSRTLIVICPMGDVAHPSLGAAYVAASLEQEGAAVDVLDLNIKIYAGASAADRSLWGMEHYLSWTREDHFRILWEKFSGSVEQEVSRIREGGYGTVGFSVNGANILFSIKMAKLLKQQDAGIRIVMGGPSCFSLHDHPRVPLRFFVSVVDGKSLVEPGLVDVFVRGEGEAALKEIVAAGPDGIDAPERGIVGGRFRPKTKIGPTARIEDLDRLPFPAWEKFPLPAYVAYKELPILFGRGCFQSCLFCNDAGMWEHRVTYRSAANIFREMVSVRERFGISAFRCNDLMFNGNLEVLHELAALLRGSRARFHWVGQGLIRTDMGPDLLRDLKRTGLVRVTYGVESFSDGVLKAMNKRISFGDVRLVLERSKKAGLQTWINLIVGFPGETEEDFKEMKRRLIELRRFIDGIASLSPCYVVADAALERAPEKFSISCLPGEDRCESWRTQDGLNTFEVRQRRVREAAALIRDLRIPVDFVGLYEKGAPA